MDPLLEDETPPLREPDAISTTIPHKDAIRLVESLTIDPTDGAALQIARFKAISQDPRCKGKEGFALKLAVGAPNMSADAVGELCEELPAGAVERRLSLAERERETGAGAISSVPVAENKDRMQKGWDEAIAKTNARTNAEVPRSIRR